jgi:hypothetical protein
VTGKEADEHAAAAQADSDAEEWHYKTVSGVEHSVQTPLFMTATKSPPAMDISATTRLQFDTQRQHAFENITILSLGCFRSEADSDIADEGDESHAFRHTVAYALCPCTIDHGHEEKRMVQTKGG